MRAFLCLALVLSSFIASAQIALWTHVYASNTTFKDIDANFYGEIYCFGDKTYSASDTDAIIVKYDHAGAFQWFREEGTSAASNMVGGATSRYGTISETVEIAHNYRPAGSTVIQSRFNGYNGDGGGTSPYYEAATTCMGIATWDATSYRVSRRKTSTSAWHLLISIKGGSGTETPLVVTIAPNDTVNDMVATQHGLFLLYGTDGSLTTTSNARLLRINQDATPYFSAYMGHATHLAYTDYGSDYVYVAGRTGTNNIEIKRVNPSTGFINQTIAANAYGANYARIRDLATDIYGNLYLAGSASNNSGALFRPWKIAFNYASLTLRWVKDPAFGPTTNAESMRVSCDKFGTVSFTDFYHSYASLLFYDSLYGNSLGELTQFGAATIPYGLKGFANGEVAWCGKGVGFTAGSYAGFVSLASPTGLRDLTRPVASGHGGQVLTGQINFYRNATANTVVSLSSSSTYVTVPASATVMAGNISVPFTATLLPSTIERVATITATSAGAIRKTTFKVNPYLVNTVTLGTNPVVGGADSIGTVRLNSTAFVAVNVGLASSIAQARVAVGGVNVPIGRNNMTFTIRTLPVTTTRYAEITATLNGVTRLTLLTITPP